MAKPINWTYTVEKLEQKHEARIDAICAEIAPVS